jgi:hypothetical protein
MKRTHRFRSRLRAAALVEAVVVLPVMLGFFGLLRYSHLSYSMRIGLQDQSRLDVATVAMAGCDSGGSAGGFGASCGAGGPDTGSFSTKSTRTGTVAVGQLQRTTKGYSYMVCNQKPSGGGSADQAGAGLNVSTTPSPPSGSEGCR